LVENIRIIRDDNKKKKKERKIIIVDKNNGIIKKNGSNVSLLCERKIIEKKNGYFFYCDLNDMNLVNKFNWANNILINANNFLEELIKNDAVIVGLDKIIREIALKKKYLKYKQKYLKLKKNKKN
jgi:hypothetical protein